MKSIWTKSFVGSRAWWGCVLMTTTLWCHSVLLLLLLAVSGLEQLLPKPGRMGGEKEVVLFWENQTAGQEKPQAQHSHPLALGHVRHCDGAHLVSQGRDTGSKQDFALPPLGVIPWLWALCASLSRAHCVLWALPLSFTLQCHDLSLHSKETAQTQLKDRVLPSCFPSPGKCGSCMRARVTTHQHFLSKSSCCLLQSFPLPDPEPQEKRGCWEAAGLELERMWCGSQDLLLCCTHHGKR